MAIALWQEIEDDDICIECGTYPARQQCKICYEPMCKSCSRKNKGLCSDCLDDNKDYTDDN
jgi:hypothetical protein